jgi:thioester reductase-like protein
MRHLVTGATGLVGAALVLELLARTDDEVVCLVRPGRSNAEDRLRQALTTAARSYGAFGLEIDKRCTVVAADLTEPRCGVAGVRGEEFWHCAADLRYEDRHWEALRRTNVEGTRNALDLALSAGCTAFNYMSTAYVAGRRDGVLTEVRHDSETNNRYEDSKVAAEEVVAAATGLVTRTLRPSIVIGHSRTYAVCGGLSGLYGIQRRLKQFKRALSALGSSSEPMRLRADAAARVNLVPVDLVAADAVNISQSTSTARVFHLTHPEPLSVGPGLGLMFELAGLPRPIYTDDVSTFTQLDREFDRKIDFYSSYMTGTKVFDQTNLLAAVDKPVLMSWHFDLEKLARFYLTSGQV